MERELTIEAGEISIVIKWRIKDIFTYFLGDCFEMIDSPEFNVSSAVWFLNIENNDQDNRFIAAYLCTKDKSAPSQVAHFTFGVERADGTVVEKDENPCLLKELWNSRIGGYGNLEFLKKSELKKRKKELAPSNTLTITCCLRVYKPSARLEKFSEKFEDVFLSKKFSDATLNVQGEKFPVHKLILSAQSPVFAAMFEVEMQEKTTGVVDIVDCDPKAFTDFLAYMYSGNCKDFENNVFGLYRIAHKYDVEELKSKCAVYIANNLSRENFYDAVMLGDQFDERKIEKKTKDFFIKNFRDIICAENWNSFLMSNCRLTNGLLESLASKLDSKICTSCREKM